MCNYGNVIMATEKAFSNSCRTLLPFPLSYRQRQATAWRKTHRATCETRLGRPYGGSTLQWTICWPCKTLLGKNRETAGNPKKEPSEPTRGDAFGLQKVIQALLVRARWRRVKQQFGRIIGGCSHVGKVKRPASEQIERGGVIGVKNMGSIP